MFIYLLHLVCYDLWFYLVHICSHNINLYKYHKSHHLTMYNDLTYNVAFNGHIIEYPIQTVGIFIPNIVIKFNFQAALCIYIFVTIRTYLYHDHRCTWLLGNHHLLHHKHTKYNFGEYWIDSIFGTLYIPHKLENI